MELYVDILLLLFLIAAGVTIVLLRSMVAVAMLSGLYSLLMAGLWVVLDAVDVAFTEAAVGAGVTTVLMLAAVALTARFEGPARRRTAWPAILVVLLTAGGLVYASLDAPSFGDPSAPAQRHVAPDYLARAVPETGVPNVVTAVLASYRGFDTLGEVTVIFTAGIGVLALFGGLPVRRRRGRR